MKRNVTRQSVSASISINNNTQYKTRKRKIGNLVELTVRGLACRPHDCDILFGGGFTEVVNTRILLPHNDFVLYIFGFRINVYMKFTFVSIICLLLFLFAFYLHNYSKIVRL